MRRRKVVAGLVVIVGIGAAMAAGQTKPAGKLPFEISEETTGIVSPLREDGAPDYIAALNAEYGKDVKPEENGFVDWLKIVGSNTYGKSTDQLLQLCGVEGLKIDGKVWESYPNYLKSLQLSDEEIQKQDELEDREKLMTWKAEDDPHLASYLEKESDDLSRVVLALKKPWWVPVVSETGELTGLKLPEIAAARGIGIGLVERATLRAGKGDFAGFLEDVSTAKRLARAIASGRTVLERLVGLAIDAMTNHAIAGVASSGKLSAEQCDEIRRMIDAMPVLENIVDANDETERFWMLDFVQQMALRGEDFISNEETTEYLKPLLKPLHSIDFSQVDWNIVLKRVNRHFDASSAAMRMAVWNDSKLAMKKLNDEAEAMKKDFVEVHNNDLAPSQGESREAYSQRVADAILVNFAPPLGRADELYRRGFMLEAMTDIVLEAAAEKARTGTWPADVKGLPVDLCSPDGKALVKYVVRENGVEVYSVGDNGRDDGGIRGGEKGGDDLGVGAVPTAGK